jgi:hypothetical protein
MNGWSTPQQQSNPWAQVIYDLRSLHLRSEKRGQAQAQKVILFVIAAAGIPTPVSPQGGYRQRLQILSQETCLNLTTLKKELSNLERDGLLCNRGTGVNRPRLRWVNWQNLRQMAAAQRRDLEAWMVEHQDADEDSPSLLWQPTELHYPNSIAGEAGSATSLDIPLVQPLEEPIDAPLGVPIGQSIEVPNSSVAIASAEDVNPQELHTDCNEPHPWHSGCQECFQIQDRSEVLELLRSGGSLRSTWEQEPQRRRRYG